VVAQRNVQPHVVINESGDYQTPSAIVVDENDGFLVGGVVKSRFISCPEETITPFRQLLGRRFDEINTEPLHYAVTPDAEGMPLIEVRGSRYRPVALCAALLSRLARDAVIRSDAAAQSVVLTMPPGADTRYRAALRHAVADAGLSLKVFIEDPIAAILGCGMDDTPGGLIAVYDFGGESFSISIVAMERTGPKIRASERLPGVGCSSIDRAMARWLMGAFQKKRGIDLSETPQAYRRLIQESERVRVMLSSLYETPLLLPFAAGGAQKAHLATRVKRMQLERFTDSVLRQTLRPCQRVFAAAGIQISDLSEVLVVGGPARMPRLHEFMRTIFGRKIPITIAPIEALAEGAWLSGAFMTGAVDPSKPRPRKGVQLAADPTREISRMVGRLRDGPDPTAVPSPKLSAPTRLPPGELPAATDAPEDEFAPVEDDEPAYGGFSFIEMTDEELKAEATPVPEADPTTEDAPSTEESDEAEAAPEPEPPATGPQPSAVAPAPASTPGAPPASRTPLIVGAVVIAVVVVVVLKLLVG
jgi:molecular chaperone DnaK (HSP70)